MSLLMLSAIFLGAAVLAVPLTRQLGLGAVLGYLAAGIVIGPWGLRLVTDVERILHFAEFGVVLLLFIIGLELQPSRLWSMRRSVFGVGAAQVALTAGLLAALGALSGLPPASALIVGLALALSSTAFALQMLAERNELTTRHGRTAFSILLFQDLAVIPILALLPLLAPGSAGEELDEPFWLTAGKVLLVLAFVIFGERFILRAWLRLVARTSVHEVFTATALLTVLGTALLMEVIDLSMGLGAFLAGVLLADSEYRHELQADIEPFKGLLLGLFFIAVGMSVHVGLLLEQPLYIAALVVGLVTTKALVLFGTGLAAGLNTAAARRLALFISQGGEFAFVIFGAALSARLASGELVDLMILVVTLSMAATPILVALNGALESRAAQHADENYDLPNEENQVIIAGFGRFGQMIARILRAKKIGFTALDKCSEQVDFVRRYGNKIYYGDASRLDLLRAARVHRAEVFVLAIDDVEASLRIVELVRRHFPKLKIYARARNRQHAYQLMDRGVQVLQRDTFLSAIDLGREVLKGLGMSERAARQAAETFREHDERRLYTHFAMHKDEDRMIWLARKAAEELEEQFEQDAREEAAE